MTSKIGFIALGDMGKPIAERIIKAGLPLSVYDINPEPVADLVALGAKAAESTDELARSSDIVCSVLFNDELTRKVILGNNGVLANMKPGSLLMLLSTLSTECCKDIADAAATAGIGVLDTPVSGGSMAAESGTLTVMVGGDKALMDLARPVLDTFSDKLFYLGGLGSGQMAKICNNMLLLANYLLAEEALKLGVAAGIDEAVLRELCQVSSGSSCALENLDHVRDLMDNFGLGSEKGIKDLALAVDLGKQLGQKIPIASFSYEQSKLPLQKP
jgi:3-hydroxyisobutyrate dehydrogenase-like beta-hydroxyacid dehydrogenase